MIDLGLQIFVRAVEIGKFSRVADEFCMSQPAVSSQIKHLEDQLNVRLFVRGEKGVSPTHCGAILYNYAKRMENLSKEAIGKISEITGNYEGKLMLGASSTVGDYIIPKIVGMFKKENPGIEVRLTISNKETIIRDLLDYNLDLGLIAGQANDELLIGNIVLVDEIFLVVSPEHPWSNRKSIKLEEILEVPLILRERNSATRQLIESTFEKNKIKLTDLNIFAEFSNYEAIKSAVESNLAVSFISKWACSREIHAGVLRKVDIENVKIIRNIYFVRRKKEAWNPAAKAFYKFFTNSQKVLLERDYRIVNIS